MYLRYCRTVVDVVASIEHSQSSCKIQRHFNTRSITMRVMCKSVVRSSSRTSSHTGRGSENALRNPSPPLGSARAAVCFSRITIEIRGVFSQPRFAR